MSEDTTIGVVVGFIGLAWAAFSPDWFRKQVEKSRPRLVKKHEDLVSDMYAQFGDPQNLTDEESWRLIREAVTFQSRLSAALFFVVMMAVPFLFPLYAATVSGRNLPYWQELLLGVSLGLMLGLMLRVCGKAAFRIRVRQLVD